MYAFSCKRGIKDSRSTTAEQLEAIVVDFV